MRFIHTSDWQLGKGFGRAPEEARALLKEARFDAIERVAEVARAEATSLVLVAGDVFDREHPSDREVRRAMSCLARAHDLRWVLIPGNHDFARAEGLWSRVAREAPSNVVVLLDAKPYEAERGAWILPAPLDHRRTMDDPTAWFDEAPTPPGALRIGLAHGSLHDFGGGETGQVMIRPDRAARARLDYLALGDWHGADERAPRSWYCGTPEPDDFGREQTGGVLAVGLEGQGAPPRVRFVETAQHRWLDRELKLDSAADLQRLRAELAVGASDLSRLVLRLRVWGALSLAELAQARACLETEFTHDLRWLDLRAQDLVAAPDDDDLAEIDAHGALRAAAEHLAGLARAGVEDAAFARAALERLYVENQRAARGEAA